MKNVRIILFAAALLNMCVFAQTKNDSLTIKKNEIGINLIPIINIGNSELVNSKPILNIFYKRYLKNNWYGRLGSSIFDSYSNNTTTSIKILNDSILSINYTRTEKGTYLGYNMGIEKRWGKGLIKQFTGLDVGYAHYKKYTSKYYSLSDSLSNGYLYYGTPIFKKGSVFLKDSIISKQLTTTNIVSLTPFYGAQFQFNKRFFFSAQVGFNIKTFFNNKTSIIDNAVNKSYTGRTININIDWSGISNNFAICYRF